MNNIHTSVAMTTYNAKKNLVTQLDSLRCQTCMIDEVLICDDGSIDGTQDIIKKYIANYGLKNWKFHQNKKNLGWKKNFMQCVEMTKGEICFLCDQDDIWHLDKIEKMYICMKNNAYIDVLASKYTSFFPNGFKDEKPENLNGMISKKEITCDFLKMDYPGCTYCIRRSFFDEISGYWKKDVPHDAFFWRMSLIKGSLYRFNESLIDYRIHSDSTFALENKDRRKRKTRIEWIQYAIMTIEYLENYIKPEFDEYEKKNMILSDAKKWLNLRCKFLEHRNGIMGIKVLRYIKYYQSFKQYLGDWVSIIRE